MIRCSAVFLPPRGRWSIASSLGLALTLAWLPVRSAEAQEVQAATGRHEHDGFYLRVASGLGYLHLSDGDLTAKGESGMFSLAIGHEVARNLILYAEIFDDVAIGPTIEVDSTEVTLDDDVSLYVLGWGAGLAYYFMPANAYASVTLAASRLSLDAPGMDSLDSDLGLGASTMAGKEWWVTDNLGLGAAVQLYVGGIPDGGNVIKTVAGALALSVTYN